MDLRVFHRDRVPLSGAAILASNHQSFLDPMLVSAALTRRCCYLARDSLFRVPVLGALLRRLDVLPVARESRIPKRGVKLGLKVLEQGRLLMLFPEGTRTRDGNLGRLRRGIAMIARRSGAPVIPVWVEGSFRAWPPQRRLPRPHPVRIAFGEPFCFDDCGFDDCDQPDKVDKYRDENANSVDAFLERLQAALSLLHRECQGEQSGKPTLRSILGRELG
jgi:1-acyl-sn-glycerol-3-phosphate acyltransferase